MEVLEEDYWTPRPKLRITAWVDTTLDQDIELLMEKWRYKPEEVLVGHIYDSLKIFKHNMKQFDEYKSFRLKPLK